MTSCSLTGGSTIDARLSVPGACAPREPPAVDLAAAPGFALTKAQSWAADDMRIDLVCAKSTPALWLPGLEAQILAGATGMARAQAGWTSAAAGAIERSERTMAQGFEGAAEGGSGRGRHVLAFAGDELHVCTALCRPSSTACDEVLASLAFEGSPSVPPGAGPLAWPLAHPEASVAAAGALLLAGATLLLRSRPRPRW